MAYRIFAFDGIQLPEYVQDGNADNMGTGAALTSFQQISNGFFDNYGSRRSPQGIRPITKTCVLYGVTQAALKANLDALRGKLGVRGKLSVLFDDGSMRWQWARLQSINAPRTLEAKNKWLPIDLTWITASQIWYGVVVTPAEWTWGDLTWTFGDGTAEMGESGTSATFTATGGGGQIITVNHGGNVTATNVAVSLTAGTNSITGYRYTNQTTGDTFIMGGLTIASGETLTVNGGDRSVWVFGVASNITAITNTGGTSATITATHSLAPGNYVRVSGAGVYSGIHRVLTTTSTTSFTIASPYARGASLSSTGTVEKATSQYSYFSTNRGQWPTLAPGDNTIYFANVGGNAAADSTVAWEYYLHYA
jgi:hypothetical protein